MPVLGRVPAATSPEQIPSESTAGEAFGAAFGSTFAEGPLGALSSFVEISTAEGLTIGERLRSPVVKPRELSPRLPIDQAKLKVTEAGLDGHIPLDKYPQGIRQDTLDILIEKNKAKLKRQSVVDGYSGWAPGIAGMVVGSIVDPINVATAFIPVVGEARYAALLAKSSGVLGRGAVRAGAGAVEGLAGSALVEPLIYAGQQQWRNDYDAYDSMLNIAGGAAFGSLLHAGAGLAKDSFGRPVQAVLGPPKRTVFSDPDLVASEAFRAKAREAGLGAKAIAKLEPKAIRDDVTGYFDGRQSGVKAQTVQRAIDHVASTGEPGYYLSADIINLGGLNAHVGNVSTAANVHYRAISDILEKEIRATGADVVPMRTGGDELGTVVINASADKIAAALDAVEVKVAKYAKDNGLDKVANPKRPNEFGIGVHTGVGPITKGLTVDDVIRSADNNLDDSKKGLRRVRRNEMGEVGARQDSGAGSGRVLEEGEGRPGGQAEGDIVWQAPADPFLSVRSFVSELDPSTQAMALRHALAQTLDGRKVDITPAMLSDPRYAESPEAYRAAVQKANDNANTVDGADLDASVAADRYLASRGNKEPIEEARQMLADDLERLQDRGGSVDTAEIDAEVKATNAAVKAATLCLMRSPG